MRLGVVLRQAARSSAADDIRGTADWIDSLADNPDIDPTDRMVLRQAARMLRDSR